MHLYFSLRYIIAIVNVNPPIIIDLPGRNVNFVLCLLDLFIKRIAYKERKLTVYNIKGTE